MKINFYKDMVKPVVFIGLVGVLLILVGSSVAWAQSDTVSGTVTNAQTGDPMIGVNILVVGTTTGTVTDANGHYSLTVSSLQDTLRFSFIGFQTKTVPIDGRRTINVALQPKVISGQQLVVVGYNTQKKKDISGAVNQISGSLIGSRHTSNLIRGLQGITPNVNISFTSGSPLANPAINIRGVTSIGQGGEALVLIDGVEGNLSMVDPQNIKSLTVLKGPAASAQYGARAAFGVIQITTKSGVKKGFSIDVSTNIGFKQLAMKPGLSSDGYTYAKYYLKGYRNAFGAIPKSLNIFQPFSLTYLKELKRHSEDPSLPDIVVGNNGKYIYYTSTNWWDLLYKDRLLFQQYHISASAGNSKSHFIVSGRYRDRNGLYTYDTDNYNMYNFRGKGTIHLFSWLKLSDNFSIAKKLYHTPVPPVPGVGVWGFIEAAGLPTLPLFNPDGTITYGGAFALGAYYLKKSRKDFGRQILRNTIELEGNFLNNHLSITSNFTFKNTGHNIKTKRVPVPYSRAPGTISFFSKSRNYISLTNSNTNFYTVNTYANYKKSIKKNNLNLTVGTNYVRKELKNVFVKGNDLIFPEAKNINLAVGEARSSGKYFAWTLFGLFYQLNYNYNHTYLLTLSGRYDGSSKFPANQRYGFFPSFSAAWVISEEQFWNIPDNIISFLKIRGAYGTLGNGNIATYTYQQVLPITKIPRIIDGKQPKVLSKPAVLPNGLTWETVTTADIGLDLRMFSDRLGFSGDAYIRRTKDMFTQALIPPRVFGAPAPKGNYADLKTEGWGVTLSWTDHINVGGKVFNYKIGANLSNNWATITRFNNPNKNLDNFYDGKRMGEVWGYVTQGIFQSQQQVNNHADQSSLNPRTFDGKFHAGGLMFKDINDDGEINDGLNTASHPGDRRVIGNSHPQYRFGINIHLSYANFFVSAFFKGVGKRDWYPGRGTEYFWGMYHQPFNYIPKWQLEKGVIWSEDNPNAFLPRYTAFKAYRGALGLPQTRYLMNVAYIQLKDLQIGYNFSPEMLSNTGIQKAEIFLDGKNLWMYSPLFKTAPNINPETGTRLAHKAGTEGAFGQGLSYPMLQSVSLGVSITF